MGIQKIILNIVLKIEMFFVSFFKIKPNRVTFVTIDSNQLTSDFKLIYNKLNKDYDIRLCLIQYEKNLLGQFLYFLNCLKQAYLINTSKVVIINNNNYVVSNFKRKGVCVLQVWHACGALKKFGNVIKREYPAANYDYVLATSSYWKKPYRDAFSVQEDHVLPIGMPRTDHLFDEEKMKQYRQHLLQKYPILHNKKVVLYAPTFRGDLYQGFSFVPFDALKIVNENENVVVIYKYHPLLGDVQLAQHERILNMNHENTHQLFSVADVLISDYSSIVFDFMILEKPLIFFVPDLHTYEQDRGTFVDLYDLKCPVCLNEDEVILALQKPFDVENIRRCKNIFFELQDGKSSERVVDFIDKMILS